MAKSVRRTFYRPHARVTFTGELVDPHTGEVSIPPSMTKQSFVQECDINNIIKTYQTTGMLQHVRSQAAIGQYVDLPDEVDFQQALHTVEAARSSFMSLPSKIRDRFGSDPVKFLEFLSDPDNKDEAIRLGILNSPPPQPTASEAVGKSSPSTEEPKTTPTT